MEILVWVPEPIAAEAVGRSSIVIYGLANVRLYIQSHCADREPSSVIWVTLLIFLCLGSLICERGMLIVPVADVNMGQVLRIAPGMW